MWVQRGSLASPQAIISAVEMAKQGGFNTLIVQVRGRGDAFYESRYEPRPPLLAKQPASFDPLDAHACDGASSGPEGPRLGERESRVRCGASGGTQACRLRASGVADGAPSARRRSGANESAEHRSICGDCRNTRRRAAIASKGCSSRRFIRAPSITPCKVIGDIAARYDVDGIHLDYIRFPNDEFDYSAEALDEFRADVPRRGRVERRAP